MSLSRRRLLSAVAALPWTASFACLAAPSSDDRRRGRDLVGQFGITTGSFMMHFRKDPASRAPFMLELPKRMREELDLTVIDLMTDTLPYADPAYCEKFRTAADKAGCTVTNLKMNQDDLDLASTDEALRKKSLAEYKTTIDAAARLGCRWVRPASKGAEPDLTLLAAGLRELSDYGAAKNVSILVENNGWMSRDPDALPRVYEATGGIVGVQPDTGNWQDGVRYEGLAKAFPLAVTCDFKALKLGPNGEHADYDLRRCFDIGWKAGFRGPWAFEHFNEDLPQLMREFAQLREILTRWAKESE